MEAPGDKRVDDAELRYLLVGPTSDMLEKGPMTDSEMFGWVLSDALNKKLLLTFRHKYNAHKYHIYAGFLQSGLAA